jgi:enolase-phosphatase E1
VTSGLIRSTETPAAIRAGAVLLDIEGTTTPIAFVTEVLFAYARRHLRFHIEQHAGAPEYQLLFTRLRDERASTSHCGETLPPWTDEPQAARLESAAAFVEWLMDRDRKSTALKELQGKIWEDGYRRGELQGQVFPDVRPALQRWREQNLAVGIFSSGSVLAQQLLFRHSTVGDLSGFLGWYFDTRVGAKVDPESYRRIAGSVGIPAKDFVFLSDVTNELDAARTAGMQARLVIRPGNRPVSTNHGYQAIGSLDDVSVSR